MISKEKQIKSLPLIISGVLVALGIIAIVAYLVLNYTYPLVGEGTKENPYLLSSKKDLINFMKKSNQLGTDYNNQYFKLTADIDLNNEEWTPIGRINAFGGCFDGGNFTISNLRIKSTGSDIGFFARTKNSFSDSGIYNLNTKNIVINSQKNPSAIGALVGYSESKISDCNIEAVITVEGYPTNVGIIAGRGAEITNCQSFGSIIVTADERVDNSNLQWPNVGGICGNSGGDIIDCVNNAEINMTRRQSNGALTRSHHIGGICGTAGGQIYRNLINKANITAIGALGGIIANLYSDSDILIENCKNYGDLYSTSDVLLDIGGILGRSFLEKNSEIKNCYNEGSITLNSFLRTVNGSTEILICWAGGISGVGEANITNCVSVGNIDVYGEATHYVGGVTGGLASVVKNSCNRGNISVYSEKCSVIAGGVVGVLQPNSTVGIYSCYSVGSIVISLGESIIPANYLVGGVMGYNMVLDNPIQNNYYDIDVVNAFLPPKNFWSCSFWHGEETAGQAENISHSNIFNNNGLSTADLQSDSLDGFVKYEQESSDENAVWIFTLGQYPRLFWEL